MKNIEYKSLNVAIKSFDNIKGIFKGYASSFNSVDKVNDTILPEAYDKEIEAFNKGEKKIKVNYDHFPEIELSDNLISISKDENGLLVEFQISQEAKSTYVELFGKFVVLVEQGKLFMSIGGYVEKSTLGEDRWIKKMIANANDTISEISLDHIAITEHPIDSNAKMLEVKSRTAKKSSEEEFSIINRLIDEIDGEQSATKFLINYKSQLSNTATKKLVLQLKSIWGNKEKEVQGSETRCEQASETGSKNGDLHLEGIAKFLTK